MTLYVTSLERGAGKTTLAAGIGRNLLGAGKKAGYLRPVIGGSQNGPDSDATFMKRALALPEPVDSLSPFIGNGENLAAKLKQALAGVSAAKDVVIVEGAWERSIPEALKAKVVVVEPYSGELSQRTGRYQDFGDYLLGVVINKVPGSRVEQVNADMSARLAGAGTKLLGVIPEDRTLLAMTVGEVAKSVQGEMLNNAEKAAELVENIMLGAMVVDSGLEYFNRKSNKAAVIRSERSDMQIAALETSTRCLVLAGDNGPMPVVLNRAMEKGIPIVRAKGNAAAVIASIEDALAKARFGQEQKLARLAQVMERHFNFEDFSRALGLAA